MQAFSFTIATLVAVASAEPEWQEPSFEQKVEWAIQDLERSIEDVNEVAQDPEQAFNDFLEDLECEWAHIEPRTDCKKQADWRAGEALANACYANGDQWAWSAETCVNGDEYRTAENACYSQDTNGLDGYYWFDYPECKWEVNWNMVMKRQRAATLLGRKQQAIMQKTSVTIKPEDLMTIAQPAVEQAEKEQNFTERVVGSIENELIELENQYGEEANQLIESGMAVDEKLAMDLANYFVDNIKMDGEPIRNQIGGPENWMSAKKHSMARRAKTMQEMPSEITFSYDMELYKWDALNYDVIMPATQQIEKAANELAEYADNKRRDMEDIAEDASETVASFVKQQILDNVTTDPEELHGMLFDRNYDHIAPLNTDDTMKLAQKKHAQNDSSAVFTGVTAGVAGAFAAAAVYAVCNRQSVKSNEEFLLQ